MKNRFRKIIALGLATIMAASLSACSMTGSSEEKHAIIDKTPTGLVSTETSSYGISASAPNLEKDLIDGAYYILHDGYYYPVYNYETSKAYDDTSFSELTSANPSRMIWFNIENEIEIPTLFPGDQIIYYSTEGILDKIIWERYYDMGYTFGIRNLQRTVGGRYYINTQDDNEDPIFFDSELYEILSLPVDSVLIDKTGDVQIDDTMVENGILMGATRGRTYDMEIYTGTIYKHYNAVANFHAFCSYEVYGTLKYTTLQDNFFEIDVPSYLETGYYNINGVGVFRLCKTKSFSEQTDFNVQTLYPALSGLIPVPGQKDEKGEPLYKYYNRDEIYTVADYEEYINNPEHEENYPSLYSEEEEINSFSTNITGTLGFIDPNELIEDVAYETPESPKMVAAKQISYDLWFPKGKECEISIPTAEGTGEAFIKFDNGSVNGLTYNKLNNCYETAFTGQDVKGTLTIGGLKKGYDINLKNIQLYENQDGKQNAPAEEAEQKEPVSE